MSVLRQAMFPVKLLASANTAETGCHSALAARDDLLKHHCEISNLYIEFGQITSATQGLCHHLEQVLQVHVRGWGRALQHCIRGLGLTCIADEDSHDVHAAAAGEVTALLSYVSLNMRGIRKILKKLAKHVPPSSPMPGYVALEIDHPHEPEKRILSVQSPCCPCNGMAAQPCTSHAKPPHILQCVSCWCMSPRSSSSRYSQVLVLIMACMGLFRTHLSSSSAVGA